MAAANNIETVLARLTGLPIERLGPFMHGAREFFLPRCRFAGEKSVDPIRIGVFGGIHGDEPAGTHAAIELLRVLAERPERAENYSLSVYPICNPTGFEDGSRCSRAGFDLNRCFWSGSREPEIVLLERELREQRFDGIIQLHADDTSDGVYGFVRGHTLSENLLKPALAAAAQILPRNINKQIDGFAAKDGIIYDGYEGVLAAPHDLQPAPFEIVLETPHHAPLDMQVDALVVAMLSILDEYRQLIAFAANL